MLDEIYKVDLEKDIAEQQKIIDMRTKNGRLTKEQIDKGCKLCEIYDSIKKSESYYRELNIFTEIANLLDFDYKEVMEIYREKEIIDIYKECIESHGFVVRFANWDYDQIYYAFTGENRKHGKEINVYTWTESREIISEVESNKVPDFIMNNENVKEMIKGIG